uniref:KIF-binding protein n=1 Tax=Craspedostauros australis TaxID=1486917 RepID=A0A7R9ZPE5_9STRA
MQNSNYPEARSILFCGARVLTQASQQSASSSLSLAKLYHTWAICEWRLDNMPRALKLFDHTLRLLDDNNNNDHAKDGQKLRAYTLYSMAQAHFETEKYHLSQHCIGLCLKENNMPNGSNALVWGLWAEVAQHLDNPKLEEECRRMQLAETHSENANQIFSKGFEASNVKDWIRFDPWYLKLFGDEIGTESKFYTSVQLPQRATMNLADMYSLTE